MRQANDTQTKITMSPRAQAQVEKSFIERTIAEAWAEVEGHLPCYEGRAEFAVDALSEAGFAIVRKPKPGSTAALEIGNVLTLPPGTEIRAADAEVPCAEHDDWGLRCQAANELSARRGCCVDISHLDDARYPLSDGDIGDLHYVVVTERATGRLVGLGEAWQDEDGDPLVPRNWLETVLGAWDAARDPQRAA